MIFNKLCHDIASYAGNNTPYVTEETIKCLITSVKRYLKIKVYLLNLVSHDV